MRIGGYDRKIDLERMAGSVLVGACVILAIRTAKWAATDGGTHSEPKLDKEVGYAIRLACMVLGHFAARHENMLPGKQVAWYTPTDEDVPK